MDIAGIILAIATLVTAITSLVTLFKVKSLHVLVNSRLTEMLRLTRAEGVQEGKEKYGKTK